MVIYFGVLESRAQDLHAQGILMGRHELCVELRQQGIEVPDRNWPRLRPAAILGPSVSFPIYTLLILGPTLMLQGMLLVWLVGLGRSCRNGSLILDQGAYRHEAVPADGKPPVAPQPPK